MDLAALGFAINTDPVLKAANDLDRFSAAAEKAGAAGKSITLGGGGSIAKLVAEVQSANSKLTTIVGTLEKIASANRGLAASNDNLGRSFGVADAHVTSYRQHLEAMAAAQKAASTATAAADSHVIAYTQHLAALARAQQDANAHVLAYQQHVASIPKVQGDANAHVLAYRKHLDSIAPAADKASASAAALQANTGNIAAQFQDIGVTAAMGMNPLIIGLQQGTQLAGVFAQSGGTMKQALVGAFQAIASAQALLTIGLVALAAVVIQLGMAWYNSGNEADRLADMIDKLKVASDGVSDAQGILGKVFDLTTGKMKTQTAAAINLARAQLLLMKASAQANISKASGDLDKSSNLGFFGRLGAYFNDRSLIEGSARVDGLSKALKAGKISTSQMMQGLQILADRGEITNEMFLKGSVAAANYGAEIENVKTATQALADLDRGKLSDIFMDPSKPKKTPKGPKTDAEKLADIYTGAAADIAAEKTRGLAAANEVGAREAARMEKQTALLNAVQQKGIPITDAVRQKVGSLAQEYADLKTEADISEVLRNNSRDTERRLADLDDETKLIGLYGDALARATREMMAQRQLRDSLPAGEAVVKPNLTAKESDKIEANARAQRLADLAKASDDARYAMDLERAGLGLTGEAALSYAFASERLNEAKRAGIALSPEEVAAIQAAGDAYAAQRHAIDQQKQAIADAREVTKGFFSDWINGVRQGESLFKAWADSVVNALNRIIDKLLDRTLETFLDGMFAKSGGGNFLTGLFGGKSGGLADSGGVDLNKIGVRPEVKFPNALGGVYGDAIRFAKGGAFTNQVVTSPTLFRFAKGAKLGEMGEAGPEAIMPLKRGPNGALGVQMHGGGGRSVQMGDVHLHQSFAGAIGPDSIRAMNEQSAREAIAYIRREFANIAAEYDQNGVVAA